MNYERNKKSIAKNFIFKHCLPRATENEISNFFVKFGYEINENSISYFISNKHLRNPIAAIRLFKCVYKHMEIDDEKFKMVKILGDEKEIKEIFEENYIFVYDGEIPIVKDLIKELGMSISSITIAENNFHIRISSFEHLLGISLCEAKISCILKRIKGFGVIIKRINIETLFINSGFYEEEKDLIVLITSCFFGAINYDFGSRAFLSSVSESFPVLFKKNNHYNFFNFCKKTRNFMICFGFMECMTHPFDSEKEDAIEINTKIRDFKFLRTEINITPTNSPAFIKKFEISEIFKSSFDKKFSQLTELAIVIKEVSNIEEILEKLFDYLMLKNHFLNISEVSCNQFVINFNEIKIGLISKINDIKNMFEYYVVRLCLDKIFYFCSTDNSEISKNFEDFNIECEEKNFPITNCKFEVYKKFNLAKKIHFISKYNNRITFRIFF